MIRFVAILMADGSFVWQSNANNEPGFDRQQSVGIDLQVNAMTSAGALAHAAAMLSDLGCTWLQPARRPDGDWVVDLDALRNFSPALQHQAWLAGKRPVKPEFEVLEFLGKKHGVVRFTLPVQPPEQPGLYRRFFESLDLKPSWLGLGIDLKRLFRRSGGG